MDFTTGGLVGALAAASLLLMPQRADACSPPYCDPPVRIFSDGASVPGNQVLFAILSDAPGPLSLHTLDGAEIPASIQTIFGSQVFAPNEPIAENTQVELRYTETCRDPSEPKQGRTYRFSTEPAASTKAFQVELVPYSRGILVQGEKAHAASHVFRIFFTGEDAFQARHLVDFAASIGGNPLQVTQINGEMVVRVDSPCDNIDEPGVDTCGVLYEVPAGTHTLSLTTNTFGTETKPAVIDLEFDIGCEKACPETPVDQPDASVDQPDASTKPDGKQTDTDATGANSGKGASGCRVSEGHNVSSLLTALGVFTLLALRRRSHKAWIR